MSDTATAPEPGAASAAEQPPGLIDLDEACAVISRTDRRVELLSAFAADERAQGRFRDTEAGYRGRLDSFANRVVEG